MKKNFQNIILFFFLLIPFFGFSQDFTKLKEIQKELVNNYETYAKADPSNTGAKRLAAKLRIIDQGITVLIQKKDKATFEDVEALAEDLYKETLRYSSEKARLTRNLAKNLQEILNDLKPDFNIKKSNQEKKTEETKSEEQLNSKNTKENPPKEKEENIDSLKYEDSETSENSENSDSVKPKVKIYEEPIQNRSNEALIFAAIALILIVIFVMWFSLNSAVKKISEEMRTRLKEHDRELEGLEKIVVNGTMQTGQLQNLKDDVARRFDNIEGSLASLFLEADKKLNGIDSKVDYLDKSKVDLVQFQAIQKNLENYATKEQLETYVASTQDKIKHTENTLKTTSILNSVISSKLSHSFDENKILLTEALEEIRKKTNNQATKELIESQLPLLYVSKSLDDCNLLALAKIVQMAFVAAYNENIVSGYEKLTETLRKENIDIEDGMIGRMALSEYNADNIGLDFFLTNTRFRSTEYPNFVAAKQEIENNPLTLTSLPNTVLFILSPSVYSSRSGSKQILKKGEYVVKV